MNRANEAGKLAEQQFDLSANHYMARDMIHAVSCHPEFVPTKWDKKGHIKGGFFRQEGPPDRGVSIAPNGRLCWLEIKTWQAEKRHKLTKRLHQFEQMKAAREIGALGFYLVKWRTRGGEDWRLYSVDNLAIRDGGIAFTRAGGYEIDASRGWPDWLKVAKNGQV